MLNSDADLKRILSDAKRIAVVGVSMNEARPSHYVARFLAQQGYEVIPVNPGHAGKEVFGCTVVASLADIDGPVDMVDIFRRSDQVMPIVQSALERFPDLKSVWMQIGVEDEAAAALARARGVDVVMNRCPKIEHPRLIGPPSA
ncbi:MAG: CoA-binding protein [Thalassovita sp.]